MATAQLAPVNKQQFRDGNGNPLASGKLYAYQAGTSTPQATYTDETAATPNANPVVLDSNGMASIWLRTDYSYKLILQDSSSNQIWTVDNVNVVNPGSIDKTKVAANLAGLALSQNGGGSFDVQVDNTTIQISGNQLQVKDGSITDAKLATGAINSTALAAPMEVVCRNVRDYSTQGARETIPQYEWSSPTLLSNPGTLPSADCESARWSSNGEFLAAAASSSPYIIFYQRVGATLTKLANPGTIPNGTMESISWSPCGDFCAAGGVQANVSSNNLFVYQRTGNSFASVFTANINAGANRHILGPIAFSPNSDFLAVAFSLTSSGIKMYERSGTSFTDITSSSTLSGIISPMAWSPDSSLFAAVDSSTGLIDVFSRADGVFSSTTAPNVSTYANDIAAMAYSPDGNFLSVGLSVSPYILNFQISGGAYTALGNPATLPTGAPVCVAWSANSEYLAVGHGTSPFMTIYQVTWSGNTPTFTKIANPGVLPSGQVRDADFTLSKQFLSLAIGTVSPYVQVYKTASTISTNGIFWTRAVNNV